MKSAFLAFTFTLTFSATFIATLIAPSPACAQALSCDDLFRAPMFAAAASLKSIQLVPDVLPTDSQSPEFKAKLADLLEMWGAAIFHEDQKDPLKKRPLSFGRMISENESVEFEYQADNRLGSDIYRLSKIKYFKTNGQELLLAKEALSDDGTSLRRSSFSILSEKGEARPFEIIELNTRSKDTKFTGDDAISALSALPSGLSSDDRDLIARASIHQVHMPLVIDGPMLSSLKWWLSRMPNLKYKEVADAAASGTISRLYWIAAARNSVVYWVKNSKKQITKMIFWIAVISTVGNLPGMNTMMAYLPMHSRIEHVLHPHDNNIEAAEREVVKTVFGQSKKKSAEISTSYSDARTVIKQTVSGSASDDVRSIAKTVSSLSDNERKAGGTPVFYSEALRDVTVTVSHQTVIKKYVDGFQKSYVLAEFKKQNTVLLIPVVEDQEAGTTRVSILKYTAATNPETYAALDSLIQRKVQSAQTHNKAVDPAESLAD